MQYYGRHVTLWDPINNRPSPTTLTLLVVGGSYNLSAAPAIQSDCDIHAIVPMAFKDTFIPAYSTFLL